MYLRSVVRIHAQVEGASSEIRNILLVQEGLRLTNLVIRQGEQTVYLWRTRFLQTDLVPLLQERAKVRETSLY